MTALAVWGATHVSFGYNMLKLQAHGVESVAWEERILAKAGRSGFAALATASSLDELRRKQEAFAALPSVSKVESALMLVPDRQPEKTALIRQFAPLVAPVRVATATAVAPASLRAPLETLRRRLRLASQEAKSDKGRREVQAVLDQVDALLAKLDRVDARQAGPALERCRRRSRATSRASSRAFRRAWTRGRSSPGDAPPELRQRYIGASGRFLIRVHPAVDIWEKEGAERFVTDLRRVDPDVTGPPITSFEAIRFIRTATSRARCTRSCWWSRHRGYPAQRPGHRARADSARPGRPVDSRPHAVLGLEFNLANVWALPLIIGTAAEFGLNIFVRFREGRGTGGRRWRRAR